MVSDQEPRELLSLRRMAARLGVPSRWLREQAEAGIVPGLKAGERWLFNPDAASAAVGTLADREKKSWMYGHVLGGVTRKRFPRLLTTWEIKSFVNAVDGHSISPPDELHKIGMPLPVCEQLTKTFRSGFRECNKTILVDDKPVTELRGVLGMDVLEWLAYEVGADTFRFSWEQETRAEQLKRAILAMIGGESC